jgi:hypothetical protein
MTTRRMRRRMRERSHGDGNRVDERGLGGTLDAPVEHVRDVRRIARDQRGDLVAGAEGCCA